MESPWNHRGRTNECIDAREDSREDAREDGRG